MTTADRVAADRLYRQLRHALPQDAAGRPLWHLADPYLLRHLARHAVDAGAFDALLAEAGFLLYAAPEAIGAVLHEARSEQARLSAAVYRHSATLRGAPDGRERGQLLALAAERLGHRRLRRELPDDQDWSVRWATGQQVSTALIRSVPLGRQRVRTVAALTGQDGRPVAVVLGADRSVTVWDLSTGAPLRERPGRNDDATALAAADPADGSHAVIGTADGGLWRWDVRRGGRPVRLPGHRSEVTHIAAVPWGDTGHIVSAGADGTVLVHPLTGGTGGRQLPGRAHRLAGLALIRRDGPARVMTCTIDGALTVRDLASGDILHVTNSGLSTLRTVATVSTGARSLAVLGSADGSVALWAPFERRRLRDLPGTDGGAPVLSVTTVRDRALATVGSADGQVRVWDLTSGAVTNVLTGHTAAVRSSATLRVNGREHLVTGGDGRALRLWDLETPGPGTAPDGHTGRVRAVAADPGGGRAVTGGEDRTVRVWDLATGTLTACLEGHTDWIRTTAVTRFAGRPVGVSGGDDGALRVWDLDSGALVRVLAEATGGVRRVVVTGSPGRPSVVAGCADGTVRVWDLDADASRLTLEPGAGAVWDLAVLGRGARTVAVSAHLDGSVRVHPLAAGATDPERRFPVRGWPRSLAALTRQGRSLVAVGAGDGTLQVWDVDSGHQVHHLPGHGARVRALSVAGPVERPLLVSSGDDRSLKVWDTDDGALLTTYVLPDTARALDVRPDGTVLVGMGREVAALDLSPLLRRL
ncbi:WD40 repeat domain-containing protein [Streptomyces sp. NPDC050400]|uniref:WD40 repeat domain-containing protein n=1 Tax=Streptomyces sp. NPDC050400 TaxID=3365610 RepID=UPI0037ACDA7A